MAVVSRIAKIRFDNGLGSFREFVATAAVQNTAAGSSVSVTVTQTSGGGVAPGTPDTFTLNFYNEAGGLIKAVTLNPSLANQGDTFFFTANGLTGGSARSGVVEIAMRVTKTSGGPTATYDYESDGAPSTGVTGFASTSDRGFIKGTTNLTRSISNVAFGGANPSVYAYTSAGGDTIFYRIVLAAPAYAPITLELNVGGAPGSTGSRNVTATQTFDATYPALVNNGYPASAGLYGLGVLLTNSALVGAGTSLETTDPAIAGPSSILIDPRITRTPLFQLDDNTFGTPPLVKDVPTHRRLNTQQGFLGSRTTNARGEGVNGVTYSVSLTPRKPGTAVSQSGLTTVTQGGQAGWPPTLLAWSSSLPGGIWDKSATVTSPSNITGAAYTLQAAGTSTEYALVSRDPNLELRLNVQHEPGLGGRHFEAGMALIPTVYLVDISTGVRLPTSALTLVRCSLVRAEAAANPDGTGTAWEYLDEALLWNDWTGAEASFFHAMTPSAVDDRTFEKRFASDATWGVRDIRFNAQVTYEGVIYSASYIVISVEAGINRHDGYQFDGAGFIGFPTR